MYIVLVAILQMYIVLYKSFYILYIVYKLIQNNHQIK